MNHNKLYNNHYTDIGFDRTNLFEFIKKVFHSEKVLYPGSSIHISPSFVFKQVIYVDKSKGAADFFADNQEVSKIIEKNKRGPVSGYYEFLAHDYINEHLPLRDNSFDLLISLYADNIIDYCRRYVRDKGIIISNNFHDEAVKAVKYNELTLIGYINRSQKQYTDEFKKTIVELYNSGKSLAELNSEYAVSKSTITGWVKKNKPVSVDKNTTITAVEHKNLLKKNAKLEEEIEILKKAMGIFARK